MGTIQHKMMVILVHDEDHLDQVHTFAKREMGLVGFGHCVSKPFELHNGYGAVFIAPSGSKVGWDSHEAHREALNLVREQLTRSSLAVSIIYLEDGERGVKDLRWSGSGLYYQASTVAEV